MLKKMEWTDGKSEIDDRVQMIVEWQGDIMTIFPPSSLFASRLYPQIAVGVVLTIRFQTRPTGISPSALDYQHRLLFNLWWVNAIASTPTPVFSSLISALDVSEDVLQSACTS